MNRNTKYENLPITKASIFRKINGHAASRIASLGNLVWARMTRSWVVKWDRPWPGDGPEDGPDNGRPNVAAWRRVQGPWSSSTHERPPGTCWDTVRDSDSPRPTSRGRGRPIDRSITCWFSFWRFSRLRYRLFKTSARVFKETISQESLPKLATTQVGK
ncbi:hypothetical protein LZ32DRAFT_55864 [Colletotrichum eremochloae]|nr:hypothetical protein LZ32DRAFT_55864 [Colletotrichum eremochloae]